MDYLKEQNVIHYFNYKGKPTKNGHIKKYTKRFHWSINLISPVDYLINNGLLSKMMWTNTYI